MPLELYEVKRIEELKEYIKELGLASIKIRYGEMMGKQYMSRNKILLNTDRRSKIGIRTR